MFFIGVGLDGVLDLAPSTLDPDRYHLDNWLVATSNQVGTLLFDQSMLVLPIIL
jgi:hypothetical protein